MGSIIFSSLDKLLQCNILTVIPKLLVTRMSSSENILSSRLVDRIFIYFFFLIERRTIVKRKYCFKKY